MRQSKWWSLVMGGGLLLIASLAPSHIAFYKKWGDAGATQVLQKSKKTKPAPKPDPSPNPFGVGVNVGMPTYWSSEKFTIDVMKQASNGQGQLWLTQCDDCQWYTQEHNKLDLDPQGWPKSLPNPNDPNIRFRYISIILFLDDEGRHEAGDYIILYDGKGTLEYLWQVEKNHGRSTPGREVIHVESSDSLAIRIRQTDPDKTGDYIRNIRVIRPGGICNHDPMAYALLASDCSGTFTSFEQIYDTQVFHPQFLADLAPFQAIRFMQYFGIVTNTMTRWEQRTPYDYSSWAHPNGAPIEAAVDIVNLLQSDIWLNMPARVDDDFMHRYAALVKQRVHPKATIYLEYHNEAWNTAWPFSINGDWIQQQGEAEWPEAEDHSYIKQMNWFGKRTVEMCRIFKQVFADQAHRIRCVMGGFAANSWVSDLVLSCPLYAARQSIARCSDEVDALAIGPYFGAYMEHELLQRPILAWMQDADGGLDKMFRELQFGGLGKLTHASNKPDWAQAAPRKSALQQVRKFMAANKQVANQHSVSLVAYEGGQHLTMYGNLTRPRDQINELFIAANRDPRMGQMMVKHLTQWEDVGAELYMLFESTTKYGRWGSFGLKEYTGQQNAPKYEAIKQFIEQTP